jgi:hypothetical protein
MGNGSRLKIGPIQTTLHCTALHSTALHHQIFAVLNTIVKLDSCGVNLPSGRSVSEFWAPGTFSIGDARALDAAVRRPAAELVAASSVPIDYST